MHSIGYIYGMAKTFLLILLCWSWLAFGQAAERLQEPYGICAHVSRGELDVAPDEFKRLSEIPVSWVDERFTSVMAHQAMLDGGLKKKDRQNKALVDEISATIILQSFLESRRIK